MSRLGKSIVIEYRLVITYGLGDLVGGMQLTDKEYGFIFSGDESVLKLIVVSDSCTQLCGNTQKHFE